MTIVLDAGALIAVDRGDRKLMAMLRAAQQRSIPVSTSGAVVAQVWRDGSRQANLARVLAGVADAALDRSAGARVGELLESSRTSDVVDGHIALIAGPGDTILTSDPADIRHLISTRGASAHVVAV